MTVSNEKLISYQGFTMIELLVTLAIAGIVMTIGIPSFNETITNSRLTTNINELVSALNLARSEAVKRNKSVTVKKSGTQWESGWEVFTDLNSDGDYLDTGEELLREYVSLPDSYTLRATYTDSIIFQATGISGSGSFVLCDNSDSNNVPEANTSRSISINAVGRIGMGKDADGDGIPQIGNDEITSCTVSPFT